MASPFLAEGTDVHLERPGVARLLVELPVGLGDRLRPHQPARVEIGAAPASPSRALMRSRTQAVSTPASITRCATWMFLRPELARRALRHRAQAGLGAAKAA